MKTIIKLVAMVVCFIVAGYKTYHDTTWGSKVWFVLGSHDVNAAMITAGLVFVLMYWALFRGK